MQRITSRKHSLVEAFRTAARNPEDQLSLVDGVHLVREADRAGCSIGMVAVLDSLVDTSTEAGTLARDLEARGADVSAVTEAVMSAASPVKSPSGIVALVARPQVNLEKLLERVADALVVVAMDVQDPGNLGAIIRSAEAMGATAVLVAGASAHPFGWKALRGSMGSTLRLPVASLLTASPTALIACARDSHFRTVASVPHGGTPADTVHWPGRVALFIGGEGPGLPQEIISMCDERVTIPMDPRVESLNVSVATALLLYEARRGRA
jgi:TrmH family RNA methyltransferase